MPPSKTHKESSSKGAASEQSEQGALLNIIDVTIPTNPLANGRLRLEIFDASPEQAHIKPERVYQVQIQPGVQKSGVVLPVNKIVSITGTHIIFRVIKSRVLSTNLTLVEPKLAMEDILHELLEKPEQDAPEYTCNPGNVKVTIRKEPLNVLLQQIVLPQSLLENLSRVESAVKWIIFLGEPLGDLHPAVSIVVGLLKSTADKFKDQKLCYEKFSELFTKMAAFLFYFEKMQKLKQFYNIQPVLQDILSHMETTLKTALDASNKNLFKQFLDFTIASEQTDKFSELSTRFDKLVEQLNIAFQLDMAILQEQTHDMLDQAQVEKMLEKLNYVEILPGNQCLENTRTLILAEMRDWAHKNEDPFFWLYGPAGTGKSTLAATIVLQLQADGILAAFFTCRRDYKALNSPLQLLKNICYRLAAVYKPYGLLVAETIKNDPHFGSGVDTVATLFQKLFEQPLQRLSSKASRNALVIVIDALDECGSAIERTSILNCLLQLKEHCDWIKVLITSRKNPEIEQALGNQIQRYEIATSNSYSDVETFIKVKFVDFGLSEIDINKLVAAANGLFIWADTTYKYLEDSLDYQECVQTLLGSQTDELDKPYDQLHSLYNTVLVTGIGSSAGNIKVFQQIMGAILLAAQPLTIFALSKLIRCPEKVIDTFIKKVHAIMTLDTENNIRILHPSIEEYLINKSNHSQLTYWVDTHRAHERWLTDCFHTMEKKLKFNIYGIQTSYILNKDSTAIQKQKTEPELSDIHYAALFWGHHLLKCGTLTISQEQDLYTIFSGPKALYWMEIQSLHGSVFESLVTIQRFSQLNLTERIHHIFYDIYQFLDSFKQVIYESVPHIYISGLAHLPEESLFAQGILSVFANKLKIKGAPNIWVPYEMILEGHNKAILAVTYSPDGKYVASSSFDQTVKIWNASTGQLEKQLETEHTIASLSYSPNGKYLATGSHQMTVKIWNTVTGQPVGDPLEGHTNKIFCVIYSPDGKNVATGSFDKTIRLWDASTCQQVGKPFQGHTYAVTSLVYTPDGKLIISGSSDKTIRIWNANTGTAVGEALQGHKGMIASIASSPDGKYLVSASWDKTLKIWDLIERKPVGGPLVGHTKMVAAVTYSSDGKYIVSGSADKTIRIWDAQTGQPTGQPLKGHTEAIVSIAYSPDRKHIVSGANDNMIRIWDANTAHPAQDLQKGHSASVTSVAYSPDGKYIVSGSDDHTVRIWDANTGQSVIKPFEGHGDKITSVAYSSDGKYVISGSHDKTAIIWNVSTGQLVGEPLFDHFSSVLSVAFSPNGKYAVTGSDDRTIRIWSTTTFQPIKQPNSMDRHGYPVTTLAFSYDSEIIISGSDDRMLYLWSTNPNFQQKLLVWGSVNEPIESVAFSSDGKCAVAGCTKGSTCIWEFGPDKYHYDELKGHTDAIISIAYTPDCKYIMSASSYTAIKVWDAQTYQIVGEPLDKQDLIATSIAFSPDGSHIVAGYADKTIRIWQTSIGLQVEKPLLNSSILPSDSPNFKVIFPNKKHILPHTCHNGSSARCIPCTGYFCADPEQDYTLPMALLYGTISNGWVIHEDKHILWLPLYLRDKFLGKQVVIISQQPLERHITADWSKFAHGKNWTSIFAEDQD